jgi:hypothetical protein
VLEAVEPDEDDRRFLAPARVAGRGHGGEPQGRRGIRGMQAQERVRLDDRGRSKARRTHGRKEASCLCRGVLEVRRPHERVECHHSSEFGERALVVDAAPAGTRIVLA